MIKIIWWAFLDLFRRKEPESDIEKDIRLSIRQVATGKGDKGIPLEDWMEEAKEWDRMANRLGMNR